MKQGEYEIDKVSGNTKDFLEYLKTEDGGEILNESNEVNVEKLLGSKQIIGNGSNKKDVYMLESDGGKTYYLRYYDKDGTSRDLLEFTINKENPVKVDNLGEYIDLKTDLLEDDIVLADGTMPLTDWRIFDIDEDYIYVILADNLPNSHGIIENVGLTPNTGEYAKYGVTSSISRADLKNKLEDNWTPYIFANSGLSESTLEKIEAKGAPTVNEWIKSWNNLYTTLYAQEASIGWQVGNSLDNVGNMYTFDREYEGYKNTLYFPHNELSTESYGYWLSSEAANSGLCLLYIDYRGYIFYFGHKLGTYFSQNACLGIRPVVKIPMGIVSYNNQEGTWEIKE